MNVVGLSGSPSARSRSAWLLQFALARMQAQRRASVHGLALRELPAQALLHADARHPTLREAAAAIAHADVLLVSTPIYKAAYSGLLKAFIDLLPADALRGKSVLPLATGGSPGHLLAIDYALKPVLGALGARHIVDAVYVLDTQLVPHESDGFVADDAVVERLDRALQGFTDAPPRRVAATSPPLRESPTLVARFHS
jgi:FMN reductase